MNPALKRLLADLAACYGLPARDGAAVDLASAYIREGIARDLGIAEPRGDCSALVAGVGSRDGVPFVLQEGRVMECEYGGASDRRRRRLTAAVNQARAEARAAAVREARPAGDGGGGGE